MAMMADDILHLSKTELDMIMNYLRAHNIINDTGAHSLTDLMDRGILVRLYTPIVLGD